MTLVAELGDEFLAACVYGLQISPSKEDMDFRREIKMSNRVYILTICLSPE
jgi:hypothetical protein